MLLAVNIRNINLVVGAFEGEKLLAMFRLSTQRQMTPDQYAVAFRDVFALKGFSCREATGAIISSVVPELTDIIKEAMEMLMDCPVLTISPGIRTGLDIRVDNPASLGGDFVASAVYALKYYPKPCIIADLETATKLSALDRDGCFVGGAIAPGVQVSLSALSAHTSQLPAIAIGKAPRAIGKNTVESMNSGVVLGTACMLDGMFDRFDEELGGGSFIAATGSLAPAILPYCRHKVEYNETLILEGLRLIYEKNSGQD